MSAPREFWIRSDLSEVFDAEKVGIKGEHSQSFVRVIEYSEIARLEAKVKALEATDIYKNAWECGRDEIARLLTERDEILKLKEFHLPNVEALVKERDDLKAAQVADLALMEGQARQIEELKAELKEYEVLVHQWMMDYDNIKNKYETQIVINSALNIAGAKVTEERDKLQILQNMDAVIIEAERLLAEYEKTKTSK